LFPEEDLEGADDRSAMGLESSPYNSVHFPMQFSPSISPSKAFSRMGDPKDENIQFAIVTKERWEKVQLRIRWLAEQIGLVDDITPNEFRVWSERADKAGVAKPGTTHYKTTESCVGFLVYVALTYTSMIPYLKRIYLALNSLRQRRDSEGWATQKSK